MDEPPLISIVRTVYVYYAYIMLVYTIVECRSVEYSW